MNISADEILGRKKPTPTKLISVAPQSEMEVATFETDLHEFFPSIFPMIANIGRSIEYLKTKHPNLYQKFFSRIYTGANKFEDWHIPHFMGAAHIVAANQHPDLYEGIQAATNSLQHVLRWYKEGLPCFFISREFYDSVRQTEIPANFDFSQIKFPFDSYVFILPKNVLFYKNVPVPYIGMSICRDSILTDLGQVTGKVWDKLIVSTSLNNTSYFAPGFRLTHLARFYAMDNDKFRETSNQAGMCEGDFEVNDAAFTLLLFKLAIKLTLVMEAAPELIEKERKISVTRKKGVKKEIWSPNVIGRKYRIVHKNGAPKGTHASPRMHYRRGHFRQQGVGQRLTGCATCGCLKQLHYLDTFCQNAKCSCKAYVAPTQAFSEYITIWIQPVLVAAKAVE